MPAGAIHGLTFGDFHRVVVQLRPGIIVNLNYLIVVLNLHIDPSYHSAGFVMRNSHYKDAERWKAAGSLWPMQVWVHALW